MPDLLENALKVVGICGPLFTAGKSVVLFAKDHSLERKRRKTIEEVTTCLNRLQALKTFLPATDLQLEPYYLQITEDLQALISDLNTVRDRILLREARRNKDPIGIRKWLLLYRPEGLNGWLTQSFFFGSCAGLIFVLIIGLRKRPIDTGELISSVVTTGLWLLYARSVSLRLRDVGIMKRRTGIRELNSDLTWIRRALLFFKPRGLSAGIVHFFFYVFAFDAIALPVQGPISTSWQIFLRVSLLLTAKVFQVDALLRRALSTELATASSTTPAPTTTST